MTAPPHQISFPPGATVRSVDNPNRAGMVTNKSPRVDGTVVRVHVRWSDNDTDFMLTDEIELVVSEDAHDPYELARKGRYGRAADLRRGLTYIHLSGRLANLVYAMGITETDFYPHQYRPLLTLLDSPVTALLIADEVGLGKTIEAGLIWTELRARYDFRRLLVVCPAALREKWQDELLRRFGVDAELVDAKRLVDIVKRPKELLGDGKAWIISYHSGRPTRDWKPNQSQNRVAKGNPRNVLADHLEECREQEPLFDLVIFDEAHHMRNSANTHWKLGELLRDCSSYQIMLSATPINLKNEDLFSLLNLLDPAQFPDKEFFAQTIRANEPLVAARDAVLNKKSDASQINKLLLNASSRRIAGGSHRLEDLLQTPVTDQKLVSASFRADLAAQLEKMSLLSHILTRTRKRDVDSRRVTREIGRQVVQMNAVEQELYDLVVDTVGRFAAQKNISDGFLLSMPCRQVCSSPAAIVESWVAGVATPDDAFEDLQEDVDTDEDLDFGPLRGALRAAVRRSITPAALRANDSKFTHLIARVGQFLKQHSSEKIIIFTSFRATARYLHQRLNQEDFPTLLLMGSMRQTKQEIIDQFRESSTARVLVSTEVAAEGVDLQFCRVLVNYDLPWNPAKIEQRIGRIDRLGQTADKIHIWNLYFEHTVDDLIVGRLFDRIRIFEEALGESEETVGAEIRKLTSAIFSARLTPAEEMAQVDKAAIALENIKRHRDELEKNAPHMMAHGQHILEKIAAAKALSQRVTADDLLVYVADYLNNYAPGHRFDQALQDPMRAKIQLPAGLCVDFAAYLKERNMLGRTALHAGHLSECHFLNKISAAHRHSLEIIHQFHPLIRFITASLRAKDESCYPLVASRIEPGLGPKEASPGTYAFYVRRWSFGGVKDDELLAISCILLSSQKLVDSSVAEQLVQAARLYGNDWPGCGNVLSPDQVIQGFDAMDAELGFRYRDELQGRKLENTERVNFQLGAVQQDRTRRVEGLTAVLEGHRTAHRSSLVAATQGKIEKIEARAKVRIAEIKLREQITADKKFVCAGVIQVS